MAKRRNPRGQQDNQANAPGEDGDGPGRTFIDATGCGYGPEFLQRDLEFLLSQNDGSSTFSAFEALMLIVEAAWAAAPGDMPDRIAPRTCIAVPWWVVRALHMGWGQYRHEGIRLEKAFALPTLGKVNPLVRGLASKSSLLQRDKELHHRGLALEVAQARQDGGKLEFIVADIADRWGVAERTVWGAWNVYGKEARERVADHTKAQGEVARQVDCK